MAKGKSTPRKESGLKPSIEQILCWCAAHDVHLDRDKHFVSGIAHDSRWTPITRVVIERETVGKPKDQKEDLDLAIKVCDQIAEELCILKPSIAVKLNSQ